MSNPTQKQPVSSSKRKQVRIAIWSVVGTLLLILGVAVGFNIYSNIQAANEAKKTYPLGDSSKLEYVGEVGYGCWLICDSNPEAIYYYATDMSVNEVIKYFTQASIVQEPRTLDNVTDFVLKSKNGDDISIYYYSDKKTEEKNYFRTTNKKYLLSIPRFDYKTAKASL